MYCCVALLLKANPYTDTAVDFKKLFTGHFGQSRILNYAEQ